MEVTSRRRHVTITSEILSLKEQYFHDLQLYSKLPEGQVTLEEFQQLGLDRLKILKLVESISTRTDLKSAEERREALHQALKKDGLRYFANLLHGAGCKSAEEEALQARRKDHISHFIMRLAYCQDMEKERWFTKQEVDLFKWRFISLDKEGIEQLLNMNDFDYAQVSQEEKEELKQKLAAATAKATSVETKNFYKVDFTCVPELVKNRRVYIKEGIAYIPYDELVFVFASHFRDSLNKGLENAKQHLTNIYYDDRLMNFLKSLPNAFAGMTRVVWNTASVPIEKLDELSRTSYPLCMRILHEALRTNHHLKHHGRLQYGLFIKGIGVTMEDAIRFYQEEFTKKIEPEKFKQHAYMLRHIFGKEGKQTNYTPYSCAKIISQTIGPDDCHGCPYKHMDNSALKEKLSNYGLIPPNIDEILELVKERQYNLACTKYFEILHKSMPEKLLMHPNGYFMESRTILMKNDPDNLVQNTKPSTARGFGTPSRRFDATSGTPSRQSQFSTPSRRAEKTSETPTRRALDSSETPARKLARTSTTSVKNEPMTPLNIEELLNDDDFGDMMEEY